MQNINYQLPKKFKMLQKKKVPQNYFLLFISHKKKKIKKSFDI
jgi:hypothetical protein